MPRGSPFRLFCRNECGTKGRFRGNEKGMSGATGKTGGIRVAVVGAGEFGRNHARVYREIPGAKLVGVYDKNLERAAQVAAEFQTRALASLEELRGVVEAVSVAVPTVDHSAVGCQLMEMGLDVLVEKP